MQSQRANFNNEPYIFEQSKICKAITYDLGSNKLRLVNEKYDGLCDILCNYVITMSVLANKENIEAFQAFCNNPPSIFSKNETWQKLHQFEQTHLLQSSQNNLEKTLKRNFVKIFFVLFNYIPENVFPIYKGSVDLPYLQKNLAKSLIEMPTKASYKLCKLDRFWIVKITGHSMLFYKQDNGDIIFYNPNYGVLNLGHTEESIEKGLHEFDSWSTNSSYALMNNDLYLSKYHSDLQSL